MSTYPALQETFETGSDETALNNGANGTIFTLVSGAGTSVIDTAAPVMKGTRALRVNAAANFRILRVDFGGSGVAGMWQDFYFRLDTMIAATNVSIVGFYNGATDKLGDINLVRVTATTYNLRIRDVSQQRWITGTPLVLGQDYRLAHYFAPAQAGPTGIGLKIYEGDNIDMMNASQDSGLWSTQNSADLGITLWNSYRIGILSNETCIAHFDQFRADTTTQPVIGTSGGGGGGGTDIPALLEGFEDVLAVDGADLTAANSFITSHTGTTHAKITVAHPYANNKCVDINTTASDCNEFIDLSIAETHVEWRFAIYLQTLPAANTSFLLWYANGGVNGITDKIGDLQITPTGQIRLRDQSTEKFLSTALTLNTWHEIGLRVQPGSATGHRVNIYSAANRGTNTASQTSGDQIATTAGFTSVNQFRFGSSSNSTMRYFLDVFRADRATMPNGIAPPLGTLAVSPINITNAEPFVPQTISVDVTGGLAPFSYVVTQQGGSDAAPTGTGATRTVPVPGTLDAVTRTYRFVVTDANAASAQADMTVTSLPHNHLERLSGGTWKGVNLVERLPNASWKDGAVA